MSKNLPTLVYVALSDPGSESGTQRSGTHPRSSELVISEISQDDRSEYYTGKGCQIKVS